MISTTEVNVDWSKKLDYSQPIEIVPMGELDANPYKFSYKEGKDVSNQEYQENYQTYIWITDVSR
jgi:hypothetical protein